MPKAASLLVESDHVVYVPRFRPDPNDPMYQLRNTEKDRTNAAIDFEAWAAQVATAQIQTQMDQTILKHGLNTCCRGEAWLVEPDKMDTHSQHCRSAHLLLLSMMLSLRLMVNSYRRTNH